MEKAQLPIPAEHSSFKKHRRQLWTQILVPLLVVVLILIAVIVLTVFSTFQENGDVERWAAISTMWIVIPILIAGLLVLVVFGGMVYGMARLLAVIPPYSGQAQKFIWRVEGYIRRGANMAVKPVLALDGILAAVQRLFGIE